MQFIDEAKIYIKAGDGGNGAVHFRREKYVDKGGPDGGDGGRGGSIIFTANQNMNTLLDYRYKQNFKAKNGDSGKGANKSGKSAQDLILQVPIGTQIFTEDGLLLYDFIKNDESYEILPGGKGGLGNYHFRSSVNQAPTKSIMGEIGSELWIRIKLKILADVGLVGLPNSGKSTFLSVTTNAQPKIANYPFTTLSPVLGVVYLHDEEFVLADIPGLIEGAHLGHGLGDKFLKHIERCKILIHLIDISSNNIIKDYLTIRNELNLYSDLLNKKLEIICLNKCDVFDSLKVNKILNKFKNVTEAKIFTISTYQKEGLSEVLTYVLQTFKEQDLSK